jgi:hypothetical protein
MYLSENQLKHLNSQEIFDGTKKIDVPLQALTEEHQLNSTRAARMGPGSVEKTRVILPEKSTWLDTT